jgi:hypothetical protein
MDVFTRRIIGFGVERADLCGARFAGCSTKSLLDSRFLST